ncbi:amidase [Burkholderia diffusa]|uniref:Amidase n=1 Tax=Burkholderia diffusa TaxID=488732 RepID=A0AAW3P9B0_9BURK|nr:amidase [Burkholderia diffusa]KWF32763.1 amidase [Burkholderia diffusa]KWF38687.1 amidase [Burkholderia diffusa]KWF46732.1 amidase [Burkholderia diffusa]KWF50697.1 amidase [Burkholderia diffusa]
MNKHTWTLTDAAAALRDGGTTSRGLTEAALAVADRTDAEIGIYLARFDEHALAAADRADAELAQGLDRGPLHGIPIGVKDIIAVAEGPTTAQSLILDRAWAQGRDAPVISRLKASGAVITGKTTTMEFAIGMGDSTKPFPIPRNPWDLETWPGGSSSGSGSGVAVGAFFAGLGTDTGGSIRVPAALCGVTGLMPTFGLVPKSGCVPLGYSLDRVGPIARSAQDCAAVLQVISGLHPSDPDSVNAPFATPEIFGDLTGVRLGVVKEGHMPEGTDPALEGVFREAIEVLVEHGATVHEIALPLRIETMTAHMVMANAEALAYHRPDLERRWDEYGAAARGLIAHGALVSGADYVQAQRVRRVAQLELARLFAEVDVILAPTVSIGAPALQPFLDGTANLMQIFSHFHANYWNVTGNPVLALPIGFTDAGLPLSMQIASRPFAEGAILKVGQVFQAATRHHLETPVLTGDHESMGR